MFQSMLPCGIARNCQAGIGSPGTSTRLAEVRTLPGPHRPIPSTTLPAQPLLDAAATLLSDSQRCAILAGASALAADAGESVQRLADDRRRSEASFRLLFEDNPLPMWVYDIETLHFLEVNSVAVATYGYSREEFLRMRITDIRPPEDVSRLRMFLRDAVVTKLTFKSSYDPGFYLRPEARSAR